MNAETQNPTDQQTVENDESVVDPTCENSTAEIVQTHSSYKDPDFEEKYLNSSEKEQEMEDPDESEDNDGFDINGCEISQQRLEQSSSSGKIPSR